jgi:hypothetical protein
MILLFFVLTLTTAFHFELSRITPITSNGFVALTYLAGSIFFLFWSEPYIMPNGFYILAWIQGISFLVNSIGGSKKSMTWNKCECVITLGILSLIAYHAIKYFISFA